MNAPPAADRRTQSVLAYGILVAAIVLVASVTIAPAFSMRASFADRLASARATLGKFEAAAASGAAARSDIDAGKLGSADAASFFAADTNVLAAADLQNRLKQLIEERHGEVLSLSQRAAQEESPFPPVSVTASFRCSIATLVDLVRALESSSPALFVDELTVQSMHQQGRVLPSRDIELESRITVTGYRFVSGGEGS